MFPESNSSSNDMLYERDRFRARLYSFNPNTTDTVMISDSVETINSETHGDVEDSSCEVCDAIGTKTARLGVENVASNSINTTPEYSVDESLSPLNRISTFYEKNMPSIGSFKDLDSSIIIKQVDLPSLSIIFQWYFSRKLPPTNEMFPWLHGLNKANFAQRKFFIQQHQQQQQQGQRQNNVPEYDEFMLNDRIYAAKPCGSRFLMCINTGEKYCLKNTVQLNEILLPVDVCRAEVKEFIAQTVKKVFGTSTKSSVPVPITSVSSQHTQSHYQQFHSKYPRINNAATTTNFEGLVDQFYEDALKLKLLPKFINLDPERGVSLRNFHIQVAKLATLSDFIVYGKDNRLKEAAARLLWLTQRLEATETNKDPKYNVYILASGMISKSEYTKYHHLFSYHGEDKKNHGRGGVQVSLAAQYGVLNNKTQLILKLELFNSSSLSLWDCDYQTKEKIETTKMSSATKVHQNVWVGNIWDYQIMITYLHSVESSNNNSNNNSPRLKINWLKHGEEQTHLFCSPTNSVISMSDNSNNEILDYLALPKANWRFFIYCHNDATFPDNGTLDALLSKHSITSHTSVDNEYFSLEFPPLGSIGLGDLKMENLMAFVNVCKLIYLYLSLTSKDPETVSSLIYCSDGYTELSLLVVSYLIYAKDISVEKAILQLHLQYGRPFYVFYSDIPVLSRLEGLLRLYSPKRKGNAINWGILETISNEDFNTHLLAPRALLNRSGVTTTSTDSDGEVEEEEEEEEEEEDDDDNNSSGVSDTETWEGESCCFQKQLWLYNVEGNLPSRILPYLYLGSYSHASCIPLLKALGITKIISVGEKLEWLSGRGFTKYNNIEVKQFNGGNVEVYNLSRNQTLGRKKSVYFTPVDSVMKVNNLQDDGIDELTSSLPIILDYIDSVYKESGGKCKILVHCRVGVSRSATVVIAEVMRRLNVSLAQAYLYVRVRRLNIIIQPNLRFMYELFKWEEQQKSANNKRQMREIDWFAMCREITRLNIPYLP
ncbi:tyrosine/serine/threonine protein phosphatase pps1 [Scheffersomyces spartinae]|uniref:Tyrosine/serine/threonine protein phosphatase pps1 n=1 Tax=Scheffersomyces spartinae TaxID=45513 RepID=A0A9P7V7E7_9ASCO|nr:tyrosine/serine/threonine protein phosphatase pps1 [Scheffersomyces spartinae]KAG7192600.1 tyrosine/serine/threonine protein phosphatase pps1 [Scheffersomyces spartinae]